MAEILQANVTNKTKDQINFLSEGGNVSQGEKDALEDAMKHGDGSGFIDFPDSNYYSVVYYLIS